jgi:hypothetical protein
MTLESESRFHVRTDLLIVMGSVLMAFLPVLWTPFTPIDDYSMLRNNPAYASPSLQGFIQQLTTPQFNIYAPLTYAIWYLIGAATWSQDGLPVIGFKIASWLAHAATAAAGWWAIRQFVPARLPALAGGLIIGLHPIMVESVAWTTGLKDLLCATFTFAAVAMYARSIHATSRPKRARRWAIAFSILAILAKPTAVVLPAMLLAIDLACRSAPWPRRLIWLWPFLPAAGAMSLIMLNVQHATDVPRIPIELRPLVVGDTLAFYISKIALPIHLAIDYARTPQLIQTTGQLFFTWLLPAGVVVFVLWTRSRIAILSLGLFSIPILPVSGLITFDMQQFSTVADHYAQPAMLGIGLLVAYAIDRQRRIGWIIAPGLVVLAWVSITRQMLWQTPVHLYEQSLRVAPNSTLARGALASLAFGRNDPQTVERLMREIMTIRPSVVAHDNLAQSLLIQNRLTEAAIHAKKALAFRSDKVSAARARQWLQLGQQINDPELIRLAAAHWAMMDPDNPAPQGYLRPIAP